ncbi:MAG: hypothetical protein ACMUIU_09830 [bacterium]
MKGKILAICFMCLVIMVSLIFAHSPSFASHEPETTVIARADEMDYRFSQAEEEENKEDEWFVVPEGDGNDIIILEPDEDDIKEAPYKWDTEDEGSQEPYKFEEEPEDEPSTDTESRR